jgi:DNA-binding transcriptional MerR regulator
VGDRKRLTRRQVGYRLGCSTATVQAFERKGQLTPEREAGSRRVWFDADQVERVRRTWKPQRTKRAAVANEIGERNARGKLAGPIFRLFGEHRSLREIVAELDVDPTLVRQLYEEWCVGLESGCTPDALARQVEREASEQRRADRAREQESWREHLRRVKRIEAQATVDAAEASARVMARAKRREEHRERLARLLGEKKAG